MQQHTPSHVRQGYARHDDERPDHESLGPCFKNETIWVARSLARVGKLLTPEPGVHDMVHWGDRAHYERCQHARLDGVP